MADPQPKRLLRAQTMGNLGDSIFDSEAVPSSLTEIAPILRVANEIEPINPRVAYLYFMRLRKLTDWIQLLVDAVFVNLRLHFCNN